MRWLSLLLLLPCLAFAERSRVLPDRSPPPEPEDFLDVTLVRQLRYADDFAVEHVAVSPRSNEVAAVTRATHQGPKAWKLPSGEPVNLPPMPTDVMAIAYEPSLRSVAVSLRGAGSDRGGIRVYDLKSGEPGAVLPQSYDARSLAFSSDGRVLIAATPSGVVAWEVGPGAEPHVIATPPGAEKVHFSAPDRVAAVAKRGEYLGVLEVPSGRALETWDMPPGHEATCLSADARYVVVDDGKGLQIRDLFTGRAQHVDAGARVSSLAWGLQGDVLVAGTGDGRVLVYEVRGANGAAPGQTPSLMARRRDDEQGSGEPSGGLDSRLDTLGRASADSSSDPFARRAGDALDASGAVEQRGESAAATDLEASYRAVVVERFGSDPRQGEDLEKSLKELDKKLSRCWKKAQRKGEQAIGRIVLPISISANGEGRSFGKADDAIGNEELVECLQDKMRPSVFPAGLGSLDAEITITISAAP